MKRGARLKADPEKVRKFQQRGRESSARSLNGSRRRSIRVSAKRKTEKPAIPFSVLGEPCYFRRFDPDHECEGIVVRCHLIKEQTLLALGFTTEEAWHEDFWIPGCNGFGPGVGGHHFRLDKGLFKLDRRDLPARLERRAAYDARIDAQLDRLYGSLRRIGAAA